MITLKIETPSPKEVVVNILPSIWHIIKFLGLFIASLLLIYVILDQFIDMRFLGLRDAFYSLFFKPKPKPEAIPKQILDNKLFTDTIINGIKIKSVKPLTINKIIFYGENGKELHRLGTDIVTLSTLQPTPTPTPTQTPSTPAPTPLPTPIPIKPKLEAEYRIKFKDDSQNIKNIKGIKMLKIFTCSVSDIGTCENCSSENCGKETDKGQIKKKLGETYNVILRGDNITDINPQLVYVPPIPTGNAAYNNPYASFSECVTDRCSKTPDTKCAKCLDDFDYTEITLQYEDKDVLRFEIQQLDFIHELIIDPSNFTLYKLYLNDTNAKIEEVFTNLKSYKSKNEIPFSFSDIRESVPNPKQLEDERDNIQVRLNAIDELLKSQISLDERTKLIEERKDMETRQKLMPSSTKKYIYFTSYLTSEAEVKPQIEIILENINYTGPITVVKDEFDFEENSNNIWIIVGIVVGVLLLLGVFAFLYFRKTKSSEIPSEPITIKITPPQKDILVQDSSKLTVPSS